MKKLSCEQAKQQIDLVDYLASLGHQPKRIRNREYWFCSPFRDEKTASFKVNRDRNIWFDFGDGKGGDLIDFGTKIHNCSVSELLEKLSQQAINPNLSFHPQIIDNNKSIPTSHIVASAAGEKKETGGGHILILDQRPLAAKPLLEYLEKRCIPVEIAEQYCKEIDFELYARKNTAIGFQNNAGGYELRNAHFKGSSSPKDVTFFENGHPGVSVFEGFFDFLSHRVLQNDNPEGNTNFLVLNSLSFFQKAKELMEKHPLVNLYLDQNKQGIKFTRIALSWDSKKFKDQSKFYEDSQDLNDWLVRETELKTDLLPKNERINMGKGRRI